MSGIGTMKNIALTFLTAAACVSCGDVVRQGRGPVFLVIESLTGSAGGGGGSGNFLQSDVQVLRRTPAPCSATSPCPTTFNDTGSVTLRLLPKDVTATGALAPTTNSWVTISRYRIVFRRADGRNTPGVDVPYGFDGAVTGTVPVNGTLGLGFELVRHVAKQEAPLVNLINSDTIITTFAEVTFYGRDQVGNDVSAAGLIQVDFGNFADN